LNADIACSESDLEAKQSQDTLQNLVEQLLESNQDLSKRLRNLEESCEAQSILTRCFRNSSSTGLVEEDGTNNSTFALDGLSLETGFDGFDFQFTTIQLSFEDDLKTSRVYSRTQVYESDVSYTSSAVRTHAWSIFSGLSLAEVSIISAIALPIYSHEISNSQWYSFGEAQQASPPQTSTIKEDSSVLSKAKATANKSASVVSKIHGIYAASDLRRLRRKPISQGKNNAFRMTLYKLVVLGDAGVGKDELIIQVSLYFQPA
jgi:hypothetical protein